MFFHDDNDILKNNEQGAVENSADAHKTVPSDDQTDDQKDSSREAEDVVGSEHASQEHASHERVLQELAACKLESAQWKEQFLRTRADLENFSKRVEKERSSLVLFAQTQVLLDLISVIDDFDRALAQEHKDASEQLVSWRAGIEMIRASLDKVLETYSVKPMTEYAIFNPELHEAISQIVVEGKASGSIVQVVQKGYLRNGVVLRPAKVVVAQ